MLLLNHLFSDVSVVLPFTPRSILQDTHDSLRHTAGNIYFNDKSTGSVVGQQPFGGNFDNSKFKISPFSI